MRRCVNSHTKKNAGTNIGKRASQYCNSRFLFSRVNYSKFGYGDHDSDDRDGVIYPNNLEIMADREELEKNSDVLDPNIDQRSLETGEGNNV
jgi:hypothetical protein